MSNDPKVYLVRAGRYGEDEDLALERGIAIIGWADIPSLEAAESWDLVAELVKTASPDESKYFHGNITGQLWAFAHAMQEGDFVVLPRKIAGGIAIGRATGSYRYEKIGDTYRHSRPVNWLRDNVARSTFEQDLLYSFGAYMTVCTVSRHEAPRRVAAVAKGEPDPGFVLKPKEQNTHPGAAGEEFVPEQEPEPDLEQMAHDQVVARIQARFAGRALEELVNAVLQADGWRTKRSPAGPDGGVDILGSRGSLGLDGPRLCVQVKSQTGPADVNVYRSLIGTMQRFQAGQGLLVCWGGFTKSVGNEARPDYFKVRLWDSRELVRAIYRNYERLPAEIQADLPLKRVWMLVPDLAH